MGTSFVEFRQTPECRGLLLLGLFFVKSLVNDLGVVRSEIVMDFDSEEVEPRLMKGLSMDSPHTIFGTVKNSPDLCVGPKTSM